MTTPFCIRRRCLRADATPAALTLRTHPPQAISLLAGGFAIQNRQTIIDFAMRHRAPVISGWPIFARSGAVCTYGPRLTESYRRLAYYIDRILKGAKADDLPIERPSKFEFVINLRTAKALGLTIPPSLLARAWEASRKEIKKRIERLNRGILLPIADGLDAAHQKCISKGKLASKIAYILKGPKKTYRLFKIELVTADGEIIPRFKQKKDDLRPGERLTLFRLMQDMYLDRLAVAGGEGADILRRVKRRVLQDLRNYAGR